MWKYDKGGREMWKYASWSMFVLGILGITIALYGLGVVGFAIYSAVAGGVVEITSGAISVSIDFIVLLGQLALSFLLLIASFFLIMVGHGGFSDSRSREIKV